jgi:hypothetical protein
VLDKWYVDTLLADGTVLLVYLGRAVLAGVPLVRVTCALFLPDGRHLQGSASGLRFSRTERGLRCGPASIEGERLRFETPGFAGELTLAPRAPAVRLREPFLARGTHTLHWHVEVPDADVSGELRVQGERRAIEGRGYRDHVWLDFPLLRLPLRKLRWGRACAGSHAATWVVAETQDEVISAGWHDGVLGPGRPTSLVLRDERTIVEGPLVDLAGLRLGLLRPLLRLSTHDPIQHKWAARAELDGELGWAVHELVTWAG